MNKICLRTEISCVSAVGKIKGSETFFRLILSEKFDSPGKQYTRFPLVTFKCCCLLGKLRHDTKYVTLFVYTGIDDIFAIFLKLGAWRG